MSYNPIAYAHDIVWLEWVAAMYETCAADDEVWSGELPTWEYATTAHTLAEEIEQDTDAAIEREAEYLESNEDGWL